MIRMPFQNLPILAINNYLHNDCFFVCALFLFLFFFYFFFLGGGSFFSFFFLSFFLGRWGGWVVVPYDISPELLFV